jgi:uncharacterized membrane protein YhfC
MQISSLSIIFMTVSAIISMGLPVVLFVIFYKKFNAKFLPMIVGMAGFVLFVLVLERSVHAIVLGRFALIEKPVIYIIYGVLMAGIFEETARFVSFTILRKKFNGIETGLAYGVGHGGIESILLVGLTIVNTIIFTITIVNAGNLESISGALPEETLRQMEMQIAALSSAPAYSFLLSGIERIFAIALQVSLSTIVFYSVYGQNKLWLYPLAIILHAMVDVPALTMQLGIINNVYVVESVTCISAILLVLLALTIHKKQSEAIDNKRTNQVGEHV